MLTKVVLMMTCACTRRIVVISWMLLASVAATTRGAETQKLLINQILPADLPLNDQGYGRANWTGMTAFLDVAFGPANITVSESPLDDLANLMTFDRLVIMARADPNNLPRLSGLEQASLSAFIATGRRTLLIGDNYPFYGEWNDSVLAPVGGTTQFGVFSEDLTPVLSHPLTRDVDLLQTVGDSYANGGTPLFNQNLATLWRPEKNVLSVLSINVFGDREHGSPPGNRAFQRNVAIWLAPEPAADALGIWVLAGWRIRRRRPDGLSRRGACRACPSGLEDKS
jgi:hypothetical protein